MSTDMFTRLTKKFDRLYPRTSEHAVEFRLTAWNELTATLDDGSTVLFDDATGSCRLLPADCNNMNEQDFRYEFGKRLRTIMKRLGVTQTLLAEKSGTNQVSINNYLSGKSTPSFYVVDKIARVLHCSTEDFRYLKGDN